jgi:DNA/RNA-binding domain of Phe-tRNA-synthetase-like protein
MRFDEPEVRNDMRVSVSLDPDVIREFPEAQIRFVVARGLRNNQPWDNVCHRLAALEDQVAGGTWQPFDESHPAIESWHEAYRRFGTNPRRFRPSIDALSRRIGRSGRLPRINSAVDAYNLVSVTHGTPAGAFDLGQLAGQVLIRFAQPGDSFTPLGEPGTVQEPTPGEVVYAQGKHILTRHWNHRDSDYSKVTERSRDVLFILERISVIAVPSEQMIKAQATLADLIRPYAEEVVLAVIEPETRMTGLVAVI